MTKDQIKLVRTLMAKQGLSEEKEAIVKEITKGRTAHLTDMNWRETKIIIEMLNGKDSRERMTNKLLSMCHEIGWEIVPGGAVDIPRLNKWLEKYTPAKKTLRVMTNKELQVAVGIFSKVYEQALAKL